jgi:putative transposase
LISPSASIDHIAISGAKQVIRITSELHRKHTQKAMSWRSSRLNETWAIGLVDCPLAAGKSFCALVVIDTFSRRMLALDASHSYTANSVIGTLERVAEQIGYPASIQANKDRELASSCFGQWAMQKDVVIAFASPGTLTSNSIIDGIKQSLRSDYLGQRSIVSLAQARKALSDWRECYNNKQAQRSS